MRQSGTSIPARRASASATASHSTISRSPRVGELRDRQHPAAVPDRRLGPGATQRRAGADQHPQVLVQLLPPGHPIGRGQQAVQLDERGHPAGARFGQEWATGAGPEPERANPQLVIHKEEEVGFEEGTGRASLQPVQAGSGRGARSMRGRTRRTRSRDRRGLEPKDARPEPACLPCQRIPGSHARGRDRSRAAARPHVPRRRIARAGLGGDRVSRPGHPADRGNPAAHRRPVPAESHAKAVFNGEEATEGAEPVDPCTWLEIELSSESFP